MPEVTFAFNIGDEVSLRLHKGGQPDRYLVLERHSRECYGGRQLHYIVRGGLWHRETFDFMEPELLLASPRGEWCEGCAYGIPVVEAKQMHGGRAHVWPAPTVRSESCVHGR